MIIDSHCHIYDQKLNETRAEILEKLTVVPQIAICSGDNIETSKQCIELSKINKNIYATVGIHPHEAESFNGNETLQTLETLIKTNKKIVAVGEIGLDYYYNFSPREKQIETLKQQIILASHLNLPCVFHVREATQDFLEILKDLSKNYNVFGYVHSFSGSLETAKIYLSYGFYIGINGIITFKNANKMLDIVNYLPLDRILIETDAPYLTPVPFRGEVNKPEYVKLVAQKIAEIKNISLEEVINVTANNAKKFFNLNY